MNALKASTSEKVLASLVRLALSVQGQPVSDSHFIRMKGDISAHQDITVRKEPAKTRIHQSLALLADLESLPKEKRLMTVGIVLQEATQNLKDH